VSGARSVLHGTARSLVLATVGLVLTVAVPAVAQSPSPSASPIAAPPATAQPSPGMGPGAGAIAVTLVDFAVDPVTITITGTQVDLVVTNNGITPHNLTIRDANGTVLAYTPTMRQGVSATLEFTLPATGTYITFCSLPGHESLGLHGELIATDGPIGSAAPGASPAASPGAAPAA